MANFFGMWNSPLQNARLFAYISTGLLFVKVVVVLLVYLRCRKEQKSKAKGLGLQLVDLWGIVLIGMPLLGNVINGILYVTTNEIGILPVSFVLLIATIPLALFITGEMTNYSIPKIMALIYFIINLIIITIPSTLERAVSQDVIHFIPLGPILGTTIIPGIFILILGFILKKRNARI